ncbi:MAG: hypothetical protein IKF52_04710, partial [Clostridia bacterium]|nr:hypothetical protein [Clostridia bacterium]
SDGSDENITPGTAGAYVAEQEARLESKLGYEISFTGRKITVVDRDSGLETSGVMEDSGRIVWNGKYVAGSGANSSGNNLPDMSNVEEYITAKLATDNPIIEVSYNPQGSYSWNKELATSDQTGTDTLSSATGGSFNVNTWRVLDINTTTGTVRLVPKNYASGTVRFQGAQGYNNAVKLLNDACSALYSDSDAGATARSINMNDIEDIMDDNITLPTEATAPTQPYSAYSSSNSNYPVIYGNENLAVINGDDAISNGLGLSQQTSFIQRSEGTSATSKIGAITTATSIRPYKTYYSKNNSSFTTALGNKSGIILPNGSSTNYWVASRCVDTYSSFCDFDVCRVSSGSLDASGMFNSYGSTYHNSRALFPVVSLSSGHLTANAAGTGYTVE